ncbi:hypothetical protein [Nocardia mangyaensis]|uniref:hypothetical protein n=1 Tax=Nocardia mangyaensis TaxID=2213200 RepID=UPI0026745AAC|nr:hypothetical protein [Nocardia mangyaensis]MDO3647611.1 hypothetical protein [Nocardia mangyaensis]
MKEPEPILDVARGDVAVSRQVSDALRAISRGSTDPALRNQIGEILAGRASVRELARCESFNRILDGVVPVAMTKYAELSDEERARQVEQGRAELERYRSAAESMQPTNAAPEPIVATESRAPTGRSEGQAHTISGTRKPNRERVVAPEELDEDDLYFQERRQRGWLS